MFVRDKSQEIINEITKVIIGQGEFITNVVNAFLSGGHVLIEGVPGLGKTLTAKVFQGYQLRLQKDTIYPRPDALRYYWNKSF